MVALEPYVKVPNSPQCLLIEVRQPWTVGDERALEGQDREVDCFPGPVGSLTCSLDKSQFSGSSQFSVGRPTSAQHLHLLTGAQVNVSYQCSSSSLCICARPL